MRKVRVWFNHWFSTAYHIIKMLKTDEQTTFFVVGSNTDDNCVYRTVCDEWETEPYFNKSDEYVDFCLTFCRKHKIDVFLPRRNMQAVSRRLAEFEEVGVKVLVEDDFSLMSVLCDKIKTYKMFEQHGIGNIPAYRAVHSVEEFENAYQELKKDDNRVCFKLSSDEGAVSFRVIDNRIDYSLTEKIGSKITYSNAIEVLSRLKPFHTLLVMPYLPGAEVSVDCLTMPDGNHIAIPRYKTWHRSEEIRFDENIVGKVNKYLEIFKPKCPCNLQFRYDKDKPYLLEVNARMSGGVQLSCIATGVNIPNIAVNRLLGIEKTVSYNKNSKVVSYIETPVIMR
jgi:carbamoylphosphate synthase large subunit